MFQFLIGSMKDIKSKAIIRFQGQFQFLIGSMKAASVYGLG